MPRDHSFKPVPPSKAPKTVLTQAKGENVARALGTVIAAATEIQRQLPFRSVEATQVRLRHLLDSIAYAQEQLR